MCLFQLLPHSGDDIGELDLSVASDGSPVTTPGAEVFNLLFASFNDCLHLYRNIKIFLYRIHYPSRISERRPHDP